MQKYAKKYIKECLKSHTPSDTMSSSEGAPLTLPSQQNYVGLWCDFDCILISFNFFFFVNIEHCCVMLQEYTAGQ